MVTRGVLRKKRTGESQVPEQKQKTRSSTKETVRTRWKTPQVLCAQTQKRGCAVAEPASQRAWNGVKKRDECPSRSMCEINVGRKTCQSPRGPMLTAAAQAPLQLQLNCCNTGSSTAASCCHKGCPQRLRHTSRQGALARRHTDGPIWAALL